MPERARQPRVRWSDEAIRAFVRDRISAGHSLHPRCLKAEGYEYLLKVVRQRMPGGWPALVASEGGVVVYARDRTELGADECRTRLLDRAAHGLPLGSAAMQSRDGGDPVLFRWARRHFAPTTRRWDDVLQAVGLDPREHRKARARRSDDDPYPLLTEIWSLANAGHSLAPSHVDSGLYQKAQRVCGSWSAALELAGIDPALAFARGGRLTADEVRTRLVARQQQHRSLHRSILSQEDPLLLRSALAAARTRRWTAALRHFGFDPGPHVSRGTRDMRAGRAFEQRARRVLRVLRPAWRKPKRLVVSDGDGTVRCCPDLVDTTGPDVGPTAVWIDLKLRAGGASYTGTVAKYRRAGVRLLILVLEMAEAIDVPEGVVVQSIFALEGEATTDTLKAEFAALHHLAANAPHYRGGPVVRDWTRARLRRCLRAMPPAVRDALRRGEVAPTRRYLRDAEGGALAAITARYGTLQRGLVKLGTLDAPARATRPWRRKRAWPRQLRRLLEQRATEGRSLRAKAVQADHRHAYQQGRTLYGSWERALQAVARRSRVVQMALTLPLNAGRPREFLREADLPTALASFLDRRVAQALPLSSMACRRAWPMLVSRAVARWRVPWRAIVALHRTVPPAS